MLKVLYVLGAPRCGSTVLGAALGGLPAVVNLGEVANLWRLSLRRPGFPCGCGEMITECGFWTQVLALSGAASLPPNEVMNSQRTEVGLRSLAGGLHQQTGAGPFAQLVADVYRAASNLTQAAVVVDTSKKPGYAAAVSRVPGIDAHAVHLVRDPRGHVLSRHRGWRGRSGVDHPLDAAGAARTVLAWSKANLVCEALGIRTPDRVMRLRYEDFVADPTSALQAITAMLPDPPAVPVMDRVVPVGVQHTAAGNPVRRALASDLQLKIDDEWRTVLSVPQQVALHSLGLPLTLRYGYQARPKTGP